ncbi:hypothetical protein ACFSHT_07115 [Paraburkholderia silviterrae]|uniref:Uncharacterized protein n=1 Tax=Paraburkholderia silviterrae TaxID=2528715 RepID=A0A4R5MCK5_9BURK|nr:hypothetical protein [Paraburkholderia silviterrae]TDG24662.1 hypothetical protein EYW47_08915 [Paraburkholderia silviterrae]
MVQARKLSLKELIGLIGDPTTGVSGMPSTLKTRWDVALICGSDDYTASRFARSVKTFVDSADKKASFLVMGRALFHAVQADNYQKILKDDTPVGVKIAHDFKYQNKTINLWEMKYQNKDRIYFFPLNSGDVKTIFLLMAYHKKDQNTPNEVKTPCTREIKELITSSANIKFI